MAEVSGFTVKGKMVIANEDGEVIELSEPPIFVVNNTPPEKPKEVEA